MGVLGIYHALEVALKLAQDTMGIHELSMKDAVVAIAIIVLLLQKGHTHEGGDTTDKKMLVEDVVDNGLTLFTIQKVLSILACRAVGKEIDEHIRGAVHPTVVVD
jgi:hypothetical protein